VEPYLRAAGPSPFSSLIAASWRRRAKPWGVGGGDPPSSSSGGGGAGWLGHRRRRAGRRARRRSCLAVVSWLRVQIVFATAGNAGERSDLSKAGWLFSGAGVHAAPSWDSGGGGQSIRWMPLARARVGASTLRAHLLLPKSSSKATMGAAGCRSGRGSLLWRLFSRW
jgi:hypothetical protein